MTSESRIQRTCASLPARATPIGTKVRANVRGRYSGRIGTIVTVNNERADGRTFHREYGVAWRAVKLDANRPGKLARQGSDTTWFAPEELPIHDPKLDAWFADE